jgi:hypothetical protein
VVAGWYWSGLVIAGSGDVGGVAVPVGSCLVHPAGGGAGAEVQAVSEDGGGQLGGEVGRVVTLPGKLSTASP